MLEDLKINKEKYEVLGVPENSLIFIIPLFRWINQDQINFAL